MLDWTAESNDLFPPGFGLENTRVYVPLTQNTAAIGLFEKQDYVSTKLTNQLIKKHNWLTVGHSDRFVFSHE